MISKLHEFLKANFPAFFCWLSLLVFISFIAALLSDLCGFEDIAFLFLLFTILPSISFIFVLIMYALDENRKEAELRERIASDEARKHRS